MGITPRAIAKITKAKLSLCMRPNIEGFGIFDMLKGLQGRCIFHLCDNSATGRQLSQLW
jgi:hypothetical protein